MEKELLEKYSIARRKVDLYTKDLEESKAELEDAILKLHEDLIERGASKTAKYIGIGSYSMSEPILYASCDKENEEKLFNFIKDQDRTDLIKNTVHHRSLSSFVNEILDRGEKVPEFIKFYFKPSGKFYSEAE